MKKHRARIVFWGTPEFAVPALTALYEKGFTIAGVVTNPDAPAGRKKLSTPPPVKVAAQKFGVPVLAPETLTEITFGEELRALKPDVFVVAAYGKIIPAPLLSLAPYGSLNIHPSLLPKFRGPSPIESAILRGEEKTGVTIMLMDETMDHGPILLQEMVALSPKETRISLSERLAHLGATLLIKVLPKWLAKEIEPTPQNHDEATYSKILSRDDGRLFWDNPAKLLERQIRAYLGWPGSYCVWKQPNNTMIRLKIEDAQALPDTGSRKAYGTTWKSARSPLMVQTLDGSLAIHSIQAEGGKLLPAGDFVRGHPDIIGTVLL